MKKPKRILTTLLVLLLVLSTIPVFAEDGEEKEPFSDLRHDWSEESILWCYENRIMDGIGGGMFAPDKTVTRAMFVTVLSRMATRFGYNLNGYRDMTFSYFSDVSNGQWYSSAVLWAYKNNVLKGYDDGRLGTNDAVSRQDMAVLTYRFVTSFLSCPTFGQEGGEAQSYTDAAAVASYAKSAVAGMSGAGLMRGANGVFSPRRGTTRAELAAVLKRLDTYVNDGDIITPFARMKTGINLYTSLESADFNGDGDGTLTALEVFTNLKEDGIDFVRLPFDVTNEDAPYNFTKGEDGQYHLNIYQKHLNNMLACAEAAKALDMTLILDMHDYFPYPVFIEQGDSLFPLIFSELDELLEDAKDDNDTQTIQALESDIAITKLFYEAYQENPEEAVVNFFSYGWREEPYWLRWIHGTAELVILTEMQNPARDPRLFNEVWKVVAETFRDYGDNVFFEIRNETELSSELVTSVIDTIRSTGGNNQKRMIGVYSYCWKFYDQLGSPLADAREEWDFGSYQDAPNIFFDIHNYRPTAYTFSDYQKSKAAWLLPDTKLKTKRERWLKEMRWFMVAADDLRTRTGKNVLIGEWGANKMLDNRTQFMQEYLAAATEFGMPTCLWSGGWERPEYDTCIDPEAVDLSQYQSWERFTTLTSYYYTEDVWARGTLAGLFG